MRNYVRKGDTVTYTLLAGESTAVDKVFKIGSMYGVVQTTNNHTASAVAGDEITLIVEGVFALPKISGAGFDFVPGEKVYWNEVQQKATNNAAVTTVAPTATIAVTTPASLNDTLASLKVGTVDIINPASVLTFVADGTTATEDQLAAAINAYTATSGYTAVASTNLVTITGPVTAGSSGSSINGVVATKGAVVGDVVLGTPSAFSGGVDATGFFGFAMEPTATSATTVEAKLEPATGESNPGVTVAAITPSNLSAIAGSYADLAAARTSVAALAGEVETRLDALDAKLNEVIASLKGNGTIE